MKPPETPELYVTVGDSNDGVKGELPASPTIPTTRQQLKSLQNPKLPAPRRADRCSPFLTCHTSLPSESPPLCEPPFGRCPQRFAPGS